MKRIWGLAWIGILGILLLGTSGCMQTARIAELQEEVDRLNQTNMIYEKDRNELLQQIESAQMEKQKDLALLQTELAGKQREIEYLEERVRMAPPGGFGVLGDKTTANLRRIAQRIGGELVNNRILLPGDFLFASGSWALKPDAKHTLREIAGVLNEESQKPVLMIVGHTDNEPIKKLRTKGISSNRHLSLMRSLAVLRHLETECNYPAEAMYPTGWGELMPVASNDSAAGKMANRRVEIFIDPIMSRLTAVSAISGIEPEGYEPAGGGSSVINIEPAAGRGFEK
ncbi:MAG: OmpA family protein [Planctomycetes bacterium]|nr:OmpA family protein [Planctomycetota bacterium]